MNYITYLESIDLARGTNNKKDILLTSLKSDIKNDMYRYLCVAFNDETFNFSATTIENICDIDKDFKYEDPGTLVEDTFNGTEVLDIDKFENTAKTIKLFKGNKLKEYLRILFDAVQPTDCKWIVRALLHNLRCGLNLESANKIFVQAGFPKIEKFGVQLCDSIEVPIIRKEFNKLNDVESTEFIRECCIATEKMIKPPYYACIKYDGMRAICEKIGDKITFTSRQGKNIDYVPELVEYMKTFDFDFILDGEIDCSDFNLVQSRIGRKAENIEELPELHYRVYDILSLKNETKTDTPQMSRTALLITTFAESDRLKLEDNLLITNNLELEPILKGVLRTGEEGLIIKDPLADYTKDGREAWLKLKPCYESTLKVLECGYGNGKNSEKISRLYVTDETGSLKTWVGTGLTDSDKEVCMSMNNDNKLINSFVDVIFQEVTKTDKGLSLRFPRFSKFRDDKDIADSIEIYIK